MTDQTLLFLKVVDRQHGFAVKSWTPIVTQYDSHSRSVFCFESFEDGLRRPKMSL